MIKDSIKLTAKNLIGWRTKRKIVVFSVDDYGNVRVASSLAREKMNKKGLKILNRFDAFDALETKEDLEVLYETLTSVKDKNGRHAIFTPFALPCNINFERMADSGYRECHFELLPETFAKKKDYSGAWELWQEGIRQGLMVPQFHGKQHLNLKIFKEKLAQRDSELLTALQYNSYTSISNTGYSSISATAAFDFWDIEENNTFGEFIKEGLEAFEKVYGYRAVHFNPPGGREHPLIHQFLKEGGISYIDTPWIKREHQGLGKYKRVINYTGKNNNLGQTYMVRNVVFEPSHDHGKDWIAYALQQINAAFTWNRPAVISTHRVNFCGHIEEKNRRIGIDALRKLLSATVQRWPDVEFMSANELGNLITKV